MKSLSPLLDHWLKHERNAHIAGYTTVCGIDEAGRGALAGPVVAACVVLNLDSIPDGIDDSKKLTAKSRERGYHAIVTSGARIGVGIVSSEEIDAINILRATHAAMRAALNDANVNFTIDFALIDGVPVIPFPLPQQSLVQGDARCASIAAASIIAKVTRDRIMTELGQQFPEYGFCVHKGYGTQQHLRALEVHGPCPVHRRSFQPVRAAMPENRSLAPVMLTLDI